VPFALSVRFLGEPVMFIYNAKTQANALKQLAFINAEHTKCLFPKMLNVVRKRLFTRPSVLAISRNEGPSFSTIGRAPQRIGISKNP